MPRLTVESAAAGIGRLIEDHLAGRVVPVGGVDHGKRRAGAAAPHRQACGEGGEQASPTTATTRLGTSRGGHVPKRAVFPVWRLFAYGKRVLDEGPFACTPPCRFPRTFLLLVIGLFVNPS